MEENLYERSVQRRGLEVFFHENNSGNHSWRNDLDWQLRVGIGRNYIVTVN